MANTGNFAAQQPRRLPPAVAHIDDGSGGRWTNAKISGSAPASLDAHGFADSHAVALLESHRLAGAVTNGPSHSSYIPQDEFVSPSASRHDRLLGGAGLNREGKSPLALRPRTSIPASVSRAKILCGGPFQSFEFAIPDLSGRSSAHSYSNSSSLLRLPTAAFPSGRVGH